MRRALLIAFVALLLLPAAVPAQTRTVTVGGAATQTVPNDAASLSFGVSKVRKTRQAALRVVSVRLRAVIAAVQSVPGVEPGDVTTGQITVREVTRNERTLYRAAEGIVVILHEPERAGELVNAAIAAGATETTEATPDTPEEATPRGPRSTADKAPPPAKPGTSTVTARVRVVFALE